MEPQDGDIADGPNGQHLVYKAGGWHPANAEGRPLAPIPRPDYGPGMYELPSGDVAHRGPKGGFEIVQRADAAAGNGATGSVGTPESRGRLTLAVGPAVTAEDSLGVQERRDGRRINPYNQDWGASLIDAIPDNNALSALARVVGGQDYQNYNQSVKTIEAALLPVFAGMAVTESEAQRFIRANQPQMGDSPETLQRKARNRQMVLNEAAGMLGREIPFPDVGRYGEAGFRQAVAAGDASAVDPNIIAQPPTDSAGPIDPATGLPTYPGITALTEGYGEVPIGDPNKPGRSEANAIDILDPSLSVQSLPKILSEGGWIRRGDEAPYYVPPGGARFGNEGEQVRPGLNVERQEQPISERTDPISVGIRNIAAFGQGAAEQVPFMDEAAAYAASRLFGIDYDTARQVQSLQSEDDRRERPLARNAGGVAGFTAGLAVPAMGAARAVRGGAAIANAGRGFNAGRAVGNAARVAAGGAATGAVYGAGQGETIDERLGNAREGAAIGAVVAPVAGAAVNALARPVSRIVERVTQGPNPLASAADRYARRFKPDVNALAGRADELEALGIQPAMIDVVDDARRGTYRALATRDTPAREQAVRLAQDRRGNLPSRVRTITQEEISGETRPMMQVQEELAATRRQNAQTGSQDFNAENVRLDDNVATAMRSPVARSALTQAASVMEASLDPAERQSSEYIRRLATGEAGNGAMLTVSEIQDISKALNTAARSAFNSENPTAGPVLRDLSRAIRNAGRDQSEGYRNFLRQYADDMQLEEAATTGRNFVSVSADPVNARSTEAFVRGAREATPPEMQVYQASAAQAAQAAGSRPSTARGVLEGFASDVDQQRRLAAIGADQGRVSARSAAELRQVENAQNISPRVGSQTGTNMADQAMEAGVALREAATGNLPGLLGRAGRLIMSRGFNDKEAEALIQASIDPSRTREVIELLSQRMSRQEARNLVRSVRYMAAQQSGNVAGTDQ